MIALARKLALGFVVFTAIVCVAEPRRSGAPRPGAPRVAPRPGATRVARRPAMPRAAPRSAPGPVTRSPAARNRVDAQTVEALSLMLMNELGQRSYVYPIPETGKGSPDLLFKVGIDASLHPYRSAVLEVSDPTRGLTYRMELPTPLPAVVHWDGSFNETESIVPDERYFARVILVQMNGQVQASQMLLFSTRQRTVYDDAPKVRGNTIELYAIPGGAIHMAMVKTKSYNSSLFPNLYGDVALVFRQDHSFILRFECTSNVLFNFIVNDTGFFYSDFSLAYRYRLAGSASRAPYLPAAPQYATSRPLEERSSAYGVPFNAEIGARMFYSTLRGHGVGGIDRELARKYQGMLATLNLDHAIGPLRARLGLEAGYTVFRGDMKYLGGDLALTYERFHIVSPGLQFRFASLSGNAADDADDGVSGGGPQNVSNQLFLMGLVLYFKL